MSCNFNISIKRTSCTDVQSNLQKYKERKSLMIKDIFTLIPLSGEIDWSFVFLRVILIPISIFYVSVIVRDKFTQALMINDTIRQYKNRFELNKIYIYWYGHTSNLTSYKFYTLKRNDEEPVMLLKQSLTSLTFNIGDKFTIPELSNVEIIITEDLKDTIQFYSLELNTNHEPSIFLPQKSTRNCLRYSKHNSDVLTKYVKSK